MTKGANGASPERSTIQRFFKQPILNNPYEYPASHWELDEQGQPTHRIVTGRRPANFVTPFPATAQQGGASPAQEVLGVGEGSLENQSLLAMEDLKAVIGEVRGHVDRWRDIPNPNRLARDADHDSAIAALALPRIHRHSALLLPG